MRYAFSNQHLLLSYDLFIQAVFFLLFFAELFAFFCVSAVAAAAICWMCFVWWTVSTTMKKKVDTNMQMSIFTRYEFSEWISLNGFQAFGLNFWCNFTTNEHYCQWIKCCHRWFVVDVFSTTFNYNWCTFRTYSDMIDCESSVWRERIEWNFADFASNAYRYAVSFDEQRERVDLLQQFTCSWIWSV